MRLRILFVASLSLLTACDHPNAGKARAVITADPAALDFGSQLAGSRTDRVLSLGNDGNAALHISDVRLFQDTRGTFSIGERPDVLQPGQRFELTVTYAAPASEGPDGASLIISSDAENTVELTVSLAGRSMLSCVPRTCSSLGTNCGNVNDGCGGMINCGTCTSPQSCGGGGTANVCGCTGETNTAFCARLGATCGSVTSADNCGISRTADCGTCTSPETCGGGGTANTCACAAESNTAFCARLGRNCDSVTAADNCGTNRTADCGACTGNQSCGGSGVPNVCGCAAETNVAFCARLGKNCGSVSASDNCGVGRTATCGTCVAPETCGATNVCACVPENDATFCSRVGANCGSVTAPDNCGTSRTVASCGTCTSPQSCGGVTPNQCGCAPETNTAFCSRLGKNCGSVTAADSCGTTRTGIACGACSGTDSCNASNVCVCTPESNTTFCSRLGKDCGSVTAADNCGTTRTGIACGTCSGTDTCSASNVCVCTPESNTTFCSRLGKNCGSVTAADNCGTTRTGIACGTCSGTDTCNASNVCMCTPESDTTFCSRLGKNCGSVSAADNCGTTRNNVACGTCTSPQTCGGTGTANVCGTPSHTIQVTANAGGSVSSSPSGIMSCTSTSGTCSASFTDGVPVTLTATPTAGFTFSGWSGACSGASCTITLSGSNVTAIATFAAVTLSWTQRFPTGTAPSPRYAHRSAMDVTNNRMILFSGADGNISSVPTLHNDTWVLTSADGASTPAWIQLSPGGSIPEARGYPVIGYDPAQNALVMFGGNHSIGYCFNTNNDTWVLSNANGLGGAPVWTQKSPASPPSIRNLHSGVYDTANQRLIIYGGNRACGPELDEVWVLSNIFSGTITWTQLSIPGTHPPARAAHVAAYDQANNRMIIQGGYIDNQVWVLTNANGLGGTPAWIQLTPTGTPPPVFNGAQAVYDVADNKLVVFQGLAASVTTAALQTWVLTNANGLGGTPAWQQLAPTGGPPPQTFDFSAWYQPGTDRVTVWGGQTCANNACALTGQMWTLQNP